jgi:hypothetical protein
LESRLEDRIGPYAARRHRLLVCPLPNWNHREFHVVIRSGGDGLGAWHAERRNLHADALRYFGAHPGDVVRVWLIAVSVFKRQRGAFSITGIRLRGGGDEQIVLG